MADESLIATKTGELFQPVRLHYRILNRKGLIQGFEKLRCVQRDPIQQRRVWLYAHEAKRLEFKYSYAQLPPDVHPIVIGSFFLREPGTLLLDLRSCERTLLAIPFFAKHLPRRVVRLEDAEIVNRLFTAAEANMKLTPDALFDAQVSVRFDTEALLQQLAQKTTNAPNFAAKLTILEEEIRSQARDPLPEIERVPVHFEEDGIDGFRIALLLRQRVAHQHWLGNRDYTIYKAVKEVIGTPHRPQSKAPPPRNRRPK